MDFLDLIIKKRDGGELTGEEIRWLIKKYVEGEIPDYQMSAFIMAIYFRGMTKDETYFLTDAIRLSGDVVDLSVISGVKVDKHSTGGVGDKVSLCVAPIAASCGVKVAKMAGRGLGHTGGTIDKLESFPGFDVEISRERFVKQVEEHGISIMAQTGDVTPADKKLYALRDVTGTVGNMSLIASSIMSKKLAAGSDAIVLDVKTGSGAFMKNEKDSRALAEEMISIGKLAGKKTVAVISDMDQPLGNAVGNAIEVREAIDVLKGNGPEDITRLSEVISGIMIYLAGKAESAEQGEEIAKDAISSGKALAKLKEFVSAQGGDASCVDDPSKLGGGSSDELKADVVSDAEGFVHGIDALAIGEASQRIGAGRSKKDEKIDLSAGIMLNKKTGAKVEKGEVLATLFGKDKAKLDAEAEKVRKAFTIKEGKPDSEPLIKDILGL